ncbi:MAG: hypothetical protein LUG66_09935 [Clostridiales bacterium]|nr:hypothetical protein [Clostridiales bacterium]
MKKQTQRLLALILAMVMAVSMLVYVNATDGEAEAVTEITEETAVDLADAATSDSAVEGEDTSEVASVTVSLTGKYSSGDVISESDAATITALTALENGKGSVSNVYYINPETEKTYGSTRPYLQITPKVNGNVTVNVSIAAGKSICIIEPTGVMGTAVVSDEEGTYEIANLVNSVDGLASGITGFLEAGKTYLICPVGTNPTFSSIEFAPGDTAIEVTTEATTEAQVDDDLVDIRNLTRTAPSSTSDGESHTVWVLGDSTACYYSNDTGNYSIVRNGYGMGFGTGKQLDGSTYTYDVSGIFDNENITVHNLAISGISSKSFTSNTAYTTLTSNWKSGDYVLIGFGHNDQKSDDSTRYTDASQGAEGWNVDGQFANSLYENYILPAVKAGVTPVIVTSIVRRSRTANTTYGISGSNVHNCSTGDYRQTAIDLAEMFDLPCIDITYNTYNEYIALGNGSADGSDGYGAYHAQYNDKYMASKNYYESDGTTLDENYRIDNTHLNAYGAKTVAYFISQDILGNDITYGVNVDTPNTVSSPVITSDGTADDTYGSLKALSTYLSSDLSDPRTDGSSDASTETTTEGFKVYLEGGDTSSLSALGDTFEVYLNVKNNEGLKGIDLTLTYDTQAVALENIEQGDLTIMTDAAVASALAAGKSGSISLSGSVDTAITADGTLLKLTFSLVKFGEGTFGLSGSATPSNESSTVTISGTSLFLDYNQEVDEGLVLTPAASEPDENGYFTVDYILSGNSDAYGLNSATLAFCYDPEKMIAIGAGNSSEVGAVDSEGKLVQAIIADDVVSSQALLVPEAGYEEYDSALGGPADGIKTAAELGMIRVSGYLSDNNGDGVLDVAYNNGILFSVKMKLTADLAADETIADNIYTSIASSAAFGLGDNETAVSISGDVLYEGTGEDIGNGIRGDIDQNGIITANDAACLLMYIKTGEANSGWNVSTYIADVAISGDTAITAADAALIMAKVLNGATAFKDVEDESGDDSGEATTEGATEATTDSAEDTTTTEEDVTTTEEATTTTEAATTTEAPVETTTEAAATVLASYTDSFSGILKSNHASTDVDLAYTTTNGVSGNTSTMIRIGDKAVAIPLDEAITSGKVTFTADFLREDTGTAGRNFRIYFENTPSTVSSSDSTYANENLDDYKDYIIYHLMDVSNTARANATNVNSSSADDGISICALEYGVWYRVKVVVDLDAGTSLTTIYKHSSSGAYSTDESAFTVVGQETTAASLLTPNSGSKSIQQIRLVRTAGGAQTYWDNIKITKG